MNKPVLMKYLKYMTPLLFTLTEKDQPDYSRFGELRQLAADVIEVIKKQVGQDSFTSVYMESREEVLKRRLERKKAKARFAVTNPAEAAKAKLERNRQNREKRKRKKKEAKSAEELDGISAMLDGQKKRKRKKIK